MSEKEKNAKVGIDFVSIAFTLQYSISQIKQNPILYPY